MCVETSTQSEGTMFSAGYNKGFSLTFENGNTVSVQWGPGNYCEPVHPQGRNAPHDAPTQMQVWKSESAEMAAWNANGEWHNFGYDSVDGWKTTDEIADFIHFVANNELSTSFSDADTDEDDE